MKPKFSTHEAVWTGAPLDADPLFFVQEEGHETATARLLFVPKAAPRLRKATGEAAYAAGRDFTWQPGSREIVLPRGSRIPCRAHTEVLLPPGSPNSIAASCDGTAHLLFGEGHFFHDQQVLAAYEPAEPWTGPVPAADAAGLARILARLDARQPVSVVMLGDSISTGANASGVVGAPPGQPGYPDLVAEGLRRRFGAPVTLTNLSVGGMNAPWGVAQMPAAIAAAPDLFLIAFGMNDASGRCPAVEYAACIRQMAAAMRAARPGCDVIVVTTMTANPAWSCAAPALYPAYRDELLALRAPGLAVADVTSVWSWIVARKKALDLTGNGVNHPNDFGHRLYADVVLALFP